MIIVGLTGGIGSGKTTVAKYMESLGIPVYIADKEGKKITESPKILQSIKEKFGDDIFEIYLEDFLLSNRIVGY